MSIVLDGTTGITTPGLTNTGTETLVNLTTTGNTTLGDATTDTLTVGVTGIVKDASGNVGIGTSSPRAAGGYTSLCLNNATTGTFIDFNTAGTRQATITATTALFDFQSALTAPMTFSTNGAVERMRIDSSGNVGIGTTTLTNKFNVAGAVQSSSALTAVQASTIAISQEASYSRIAAFGPNSSTAGTLYLYVIDSNGGNQNGIVINSSGNVGINTTTTTRARLNIDTDGTNTSAGYGLALTNTAGGGATWTLQCGDQGISNGAFTIRQTGISGTTWFKIEATTGYLTVQGVYNLTTASAANVFVGTGGDLRRSTSSLKYKTDVQDATYGLAEVMVLRPVTYKGKNDGDTIFGGLIAEEVDAAGLTEFVQYADDGTPDALAYGNMVSLCIKAIQEQQALITALTARIEALETK